MSRDTEGAGTDGDCSGNVNYQRYGSGTVPANVGGVSYILAELPPNPSVKSPYSTVGGAGGGPESVGYGYKISS